MSPLKENTKKMYATRKNTQGKIFFISEFDFICKRRKYKFKTRPKVNNQLGFESLKCICRLFVYSSLLTQVQMATPWLKNSFKSFDFSNIAGQPHDMPNYLEKLPLFHGDNSIGDKEHWDEYIDHITTHRVCHIDVLY